MALAANTSHDYLYQMCSENWAIIILQGHTFVVFADTEYRGRQPVYVKKYDMDNGKRLLPGPTKRSQQHKEKRTFHVIYDMPRKLNKRMKVV